MAKQQVAKKKTKKNIVAGRAVMMNGNINTMHSLLDMLPLIIRVILRPLL